jgi:ADP-ribose pyrophosphatase
MNLEEKHISSISRFKGNIIEFETQTVMLPNGKYATRDVILHPGASAVIPLTDDGYIYLVKQYRKPLDLCLTEIPAGKLDKDEDPQKCAIRELQEETGLVAKNVRHLVSIHTAPGFSNECLHLYLATGLTEGECNQDEDEFLSVEKKHVNELIDMIYKGQISDSKTIIGVFMAKKYFDETF